MKWFKHLVDSGDDPDVGKIINKFGPRGYYAFFRTLEIMAREFDINNPGKNTFSLRWLSSRYSCRLGVKFMTRFFQYTARIKRIYCKIHRDTIILNCPKLKELADEYTEKRLKHIGTNSRQVSGQSRDNVPHKNKNKNKIKIKKKNKKIKKDIYISLWNLFAKKNRLAEIQVIEAGSSRESQLKARIKKMGDQPEKFFAEFLEKIKNQPFLLGANKDEWVITFDWIIKASNYQKIIEEQYKKRGQAEPELWKGPKNKKEVDPF